MKIKKFSTVSPEEKDGQHPYEYLNKMKNKRKYFADGKFRSMLKSS